MFSFGHFSCQPVELSAKNKVPGTEWLSLKTKKIDTWAKNPNLRGRNKNDISAKSFEKTRWFLSIFVSFNLSRRSADIHQTYYEQNLTHSLQETFDWLFSHCDNDYKRFDKFARRM